jgi:S-(hydroxymethyl)glutathione dehydrogenase/alcohol dehydrogenase
MKAAVLHQAGAALRVEEVTLEAPRAEMISVGAGDFTRSDRILTSAYYGGCSPARDFPRILDLYVAGRLKLDELITRRRPLDQINEAFADMVSGEAIRTVITF